jgi:hypothetical protein
MTHQELLGILQALQEPASPKTKEEALTALIRYAK